MKKQLFAGLIAAIIIVCTTTAVLAANETTGSMTVSYTVEPTDSYTVSIPATVNINDLHYTNITAPIVDIQEGKRLYVDIDIERSFSDGIFYLYKDKGTDDEYALSCSVSVGAASAIGGEYRISDDKRMVAKFFPNNTSSVQYGRLFFYPANDANAPAGTYTGTLYFTIYVADSQ